MWPETRGQAARLVNHTENHTYFVGNDLVLRVHPPTRSRAAIGDELNWLAELRAASDLTLPEPVGSIQEVGGRCAVLFRRIAGREPEPSPQLYQRLGAMAATLHQYAGQGPNRPVWDARLLDADGPWGDWRTLGPDLGDVARNLRQSLAAYGSGADRFGLIHADMRLANVLADGDDLALIDFDDCGAGWLMYDFAAAVSFIETDPRLPAFRNAWLEGYSRLRSLGTRDIDILPVMVLLRRMALLAWLADHRETSLGLRYAEGFAADTRRLADGWL